MGSNRLRSLLQQHRRSRGWSQAGLADRAGVSRAEVSGIETGRLIPSTSVALALAKVLSCRVEDLFQLGESSATGPVWASKPRRDSCPFWRATIQGRIVHHPAEPTALGVIGYDGWSGCGRQRLHADSDPDGTLVVAGCDPAVSLLGSEIARLSGFRMLALTRSSRAALELLRRAMVHVAGVHLGDGTARSRNEDFVREILGPGYCLLRVARWEEGVALSRTLGIRSVGGAVRANLRWVGREEGSGARRCLDEILTQRSKRRQPVRHAASDHRGVVQAIQSGFAEAGVCIRLCAEEAGLSFLPVRVEDYDLCYPVTLEGDPRWAALVHSVRSSAYRQAVSNLEGYDAASTGETHAIT